MTRPKNNRLIHQPPIFTEFKPSGIKGRDLETVIMSIDEFEAIRLADYLNYTQEEASVEMQISRSTFSRLIDKARQKLSEMLINGKRIVIEGGNIHFKNNILKCKKCGYLFETKMINKIETCPNCSNHEFINLAGRFGHGRCCVE